MARSVANLAVSVTARTAGFSKGMKTAQRELRQFSDSVKASSKRIAVFTTAAVAAGAALGAYYVKQSFTALDATAKLSDRLGIATEKLMALQHAASLSGIELRVLEKGMQNMVRNVTEATTGTGEAVDALAALKLSAKELAMLSPDEMMLRLADALRGVTLQSDRVLIAYKLFGGRGTAILNLLQKGSANVRELMSEVEKMGGAFSRLDLSRVEAANDAINNLRRSSRVLADVVAVSLAPYVELLADRVRGLRFAAADAGPIVIKAFEGMATGVAHFADAIGTSQRKLLEFKIRAATGLSSFKQFLRDHPPRSGRLIGLGGQPDVVLDRGKLDNEIAGLGQMVTELFEELDALSGKQSVVSQVEDVFRNLRAEIRAQDSAWQDLQMGPKQYDDAMGSVYDTTTAAADALKSLEDAAKGIYDKTRTPMENFKKSMEELSLVRFHQLIDDDRFRRWHKMLKDELLDATGGVAATGGDGVGVSGFLSAQEIGLAPGMIPTQATAGQYGQAYARVQEQQLTKLEQIQQHLARIERQKATMSP